MLKVIASIALFWFFAFPVAAQLTADSLEWAEWGDPERFLIRFQRSKADTTLLHGRFTVRFQGNTVIDGSFKRNRKAGEWSFFDPETGARSASGNYLGGMQHETWTYASNEGTPRAEKTFYFGDLQGPAKSYYTNGNLRATFRHLNENKLSSLVYFYPNGDTAVYRSFNTDTHPWRAQHRSFYRKGPRYENYSYLIDTTSSTRWITALDPVVHFFCSSPLDDALLPDALLSLDGTYRKYHSTGYQWELFAYVRDTLDAVFSVNNQWGEPVDYGGYGLRPNAPASGALIRYHATGDTASVEHYVKGVRQGAARYYDENERKLAKGYFTDGYPSGEWTFYDRDSRPQAIHRFVGRDSIFVEVTRRNDIRDSEGLYVNRLKEGTWVTYDFYGDTAEVSSFTGGMRDGAFRSYLNGARRKSGYYRENVRTGLWATYNNFGKVSWSDTLPDVRTSGKYGSAAFYELSFPVRSTFDHRTFYETAQLLPIFNEPFLRIIDGKAYNVTMQAGRDDGEAVFALYVEDTGHVVGLESVKFNRDEWYKTGLLALQQIPYLKPASLQGVPKRSIQLISFYFEPL